MPQCSVCHCDHQLARSQPYPLERRLASMCFACAKAERDESSWLSTVIGSVSPGRIAISANRWHINSHSADSRSRSGNLEPRATSRRIA